MLQGIKISETGSKWPAVVALLWSAKRQLYQRFGGDRIVVLPMVDMDMDQICGVFFNRLFTLPDNFKTAVQ